MKSKLAIVSLVVGISAFINLFSMEKSLLAIFIGYFALKEILSNPELKGKKSAYAGIVLGSLHILITITVLIIYGPQIVGFINKLK